MADMMQNGFRKLNAWQKALELALNTYKITSSFPKAEQYGLTSQLRRAAISVSANIAEGYERQHRKEYVQFLSIAKGSLGEVETFFIIAERLGHVSHDTYVAFEEKRKETARILSGLINSLKP